MSGRTRNMAADAAHLAGLGAGARATAARLSRRRVLSPLARFRRGILAKNSRTHPRAQACYASVTSPVLGRLNSPKKLPSSETRHMGYTNCKPVGCGAVLGACGQQWGREGLKS